MSRTQGWSVLVGGLALSGSAAVAAPPAATSVKPPALRPVTMRIDAHRSAPLRIRRCPGRPDILVVGVRYLGTASSPDRRLVGAITLSATVRVSQTTGVGHTTGTFVIRRPGDGRVRVRGLVRQLETEGASKFDGLLVGRLSGGREQLVSTYSGRADLATGRLVANVGDDQPVAAANAGVIAPAAC